MVLPSQLRGGGQNPVLTALPSVHPLLWPDSELQRPPLLQECLLQDSEASAGHGCRGLVLPDVTPAPAHFEAASVVEPLAKEAVDVDRGCAGGVVVPPGASIASPAAR